MSFVTLQGIHDAISNLAPRPGTLQERLLSTLHSYFLTEENLEKITSISADELVKALWNVDSEEEIRKKKKNLSSLKSALNKRFKELADLDQNPEGLIIGKDNVFTISEEHKNSLLNKLGITSGSDPAMDIFASMRGLLDSIAAGGDAEKLKSMLSELDKTRETIDRLIQDKGAGTGTVGEEDESSGVLDEDSGYSSALAENQPGSIGELTGQGYGGDVPGLGQNAGTSQLDGGGPDSAQQDIEVLEEDELVEELFDDEIEQEIIEEEDLLEVSDEEKDLLEAEGDESAEDLGDETVTGSAIGVGRQPGGIGDTTGQGPGGELAAGLGPDAGTVQLDGGGPDSAQQDIEVLDEEELIDEEELLEVAEEEEDLLEAEGDESAEDLGDEAGAGSAAGAGGQPGGIGGPTGQGLGGELAAGLGPDAGTVQLDGGGPDSALEDIEVLEDEELLDKKELIDDEELIEVAEEDIVEEEEADLYEVDETDLIEQDDDIREGMPSPEDNRVGGEEGGPSLPGTGHEAEKTENSSGRPLDLSRYIEPSDALQNLPDTLNESNDEFISMIMQRFMPPFIQIPAGSYPVGSKHHRSMDRPEHTVILKNFHISQIPVTNDIFDFFIRETGYETDAEKKGYGTVVEGRFSRKTDPDTGKESLVINPGVRFHHVEGASWRHPKGPYSSLENKASHPVVQVSRRDAVAFASWAGKKLPSEDEWEAAARGKEGLLFPWGNEWRDTYGNFESSQLGDTTPVTQYGKKSMSPFGLLDMLGNVLEWTSSHPLDAGTEPNSPRLSILKGGSWATGGSITAATRFLEGDNTWSNIIGFRCAV